MENDKHFLNMQWLLWNSSCQLDAYTLQNPTTVRRSKNRLTQSGLRTSNWLNQRPLDWTTTGDDESTTYFDGESSHLVLMLHLQLLVTKLVVLAFQLTAGTDIITLTVCAYLHHFFHWHIHSQHPNTVCSVCCHTRTATVLPVTVTRSDIAPFCCL